MKYLIIIIQLSLSVSFVNSQTKDDNYPESVNDSIKSLSKKLSGQWILKGYYFNNEYKDRTLESYLWEKNYSESLIQTINGIIKITERDGKIEKKELTDYLDITTLSFRTNGSGSYSHIIEQNENSENEDEWLIHYETCQPFTEIIYKYEKYFIRYIGISGDDDYLIQLVDNNSLEIINEKNERIVYRKLKNNTL